MINGFQTYGRVVFVGDSNLPWDEKEKYHRRGIIAATRLSYLIYMIIAIFIIASALEGKSFKPPFAIAMLTLLVKWLTNRLSLWMLLDKHKTLHPEHVALTNTTFQDREGPSAYQQTIGFGFFFAFCMFQYLHGIHDCIETYDGLTKQPIMLKAMQHYYRCIRVYIDPDLKVHNITAMAPYLRQKSLEFPRYAVALIVGIMSGFAVTDCFRGYELRVNGTKIWEWGTLGFAATIVLILYFCLVVLPYEIGRAFCCCKCDHDSVTLTNIQQSLYFAIAIYLIGLFSHIAFLRNRFDVLNRLAISFTLLGIGAVYLSYLNVGLGDTVNMVSAASGGVAIFLGDRARGKLTDEINRAVKRLDDRHAPEPSCKDALYRCCHSIRETFEARREAFERWRGLRVGPQQRIRAVGEAPRGAAIIEIGEAKEAAAANEG